MSVTIEASFSRSKGGLLVQFPDFGLEVVEGGAQRSGQVVGVGEQGVPLGSEDTEVQLAVEERDFQTVAGGGIAVRLRDAVDEALEAEPAEVVGHLRGRIRAAAERFDVRA